MKVLVAFGTRPEAVKLAPVIAALKRRPGIDTHIAVTAQHRELLDQVLRVFAIVPDTDLEVMEPGQTLAQLSGRVMTAVDRLIAAELPDLLLVQGDTTSAFVCALAAFYRGVTIGHVEAGLRTASRVNPFPEEMNRRLTTALASLHFAPTERARASLLTEGIADGAIFVTGNTVIDALTQIRASDAYRATRAPIQPGPGERLLVVTLHRRESWGVPLAGMCQALRTIVEERRDVRVVIPVHLNPAVAAVVREQLEGAPRIDLIQPLDYLEFIALMEASWIILTDSGGVQEEAPVLGRPVLVLRETTERPEAVEQGVSRLVGTDPRAIVAAVSGLLDNPEQHRQMSRPTSPFGDGLAAERIADLVAAHAGVGDMTGSGWNIT